MIYFLILNKYFFCFVLYFWFLHSFPKIAWVYESCDTSGTCWERLRAGREGDRGWDGWMASPTQWTWVWVNSRSWWWTGRPGVLQSVGSQRVRHDWATELTDSIKYFFTCRVISEVNAGSESINSPQSQQWHTNGQVSSLLALLKQSTRDWVA